MAAPRYPNRTGEIGTLSAGVVTLSGQPLPGMRTFADALAATRIADGDNVGVAIRATSDGNRWAVWRGVYDATAGTIEPDLVEDTSTDTIPADAMVEVVACVTDSILRNMTYVEPAYDYGPDAWTPGDDPPPIEWSAMDEAWRFIGDTSDSAQLMPSTAIAALRPVSVSVDVFVPYGGDLVQAQTRAQIELQYDGAGDDYGWIYVVAGAGVTYGWNTLTGYFDTQTGDIMRLNLHAHIDDVAGYRYRNIVFAFT